jgi:hypothetical protein
MMCVVAVGLVTMVVAGHAPASAAVAATPGVTPTFNGSVYAVTIADGIGYVGGDFTAALVKGKQVARERLAAFDATTGALLSWAPTADKVVRAIAVNGPDVWLAGDFQTVDGQPRDSLASVATASGAVSPIHHKISGGAPRALAIGQGRLYLAGLFTGIDDRPRANVAAVSLETGELSGWAPTTDDVVEAIAVGGDRIYLAGSFHRTNGISTTARLIAVKPDATVDLTFRPQPDAVVHAVVISDTRIYAALGGVGGRLIAYSTTGKAQWTVTADGDVQAVTTMGGTIYAGGHFDNVCTSDKTADHGVCLDGSVPRVKLFAADGTGKLLPWAPQGNGIRGVLTMTAAPGIGVAAGGEFTTINGVTQKRLALFG